jgi:hypothetical protein
VYVRDGGDGGNRDVAKERGPVVVFRIVDNPSLPRGRVGVGTREGKGVEESGMVRAKAKGEGDFAVGGREGKVKQSGVDEEQVDEGV